MELETFAKLFNLSKGSQIVMSKLQQGHITPLAISNHSDLTRQGVYKILTSLSDQGLVFSDIENGKKSWRIATVNELQDVFSQAKGEMFPDSNNEVQSVQIHRGETAVTKLLKNIFSVHKNEKCVGLQGDAVYDDWKQMFGLDEIHRLNKLIKKNNMIIQAILPEGHFERSIQIMGKEWAENFEGRSYRANLIDEQYFHHKAEMFFFKNKAYLICLHDEIIIEIAHSEIFKMLTLLVSFVQENSTLVDGNKRLRELMQ